MEFRKGVSIGLILLALQPGCGLMAPTVRKPAPEEEAAVRSGEKAIVLLRLAPRLDNVPVTPLGKAYDLEDGFWLFQAEIDRREKPKGRLSLLASSEEAAASNWAYQLLSPGAHWVGVLAPGAALRPGGDLYLRGTRYFLEVPAGEPVVYAGTLAVDCELVPKLFFWKSVGRCDHPEVRDESDAAREAARRDFGEGRPVATSLLRPQVRQTYPGRPGDLFPMGLLIEDPGEFGVPDWVGRGVGRATGLGGMRGEDAAGFFQWGMGGVMAGIGYVLYLPFGAVGGYIAGSHSATKWGPCVEGLGARIVAWSPPAAVRDSFREALVRRGVGEVHPVDNAAATRGGETPVLRTLLRVRVLGVAFRECGTRWNFCPEMVVRARLEDARSGLGLFDETLVYSDLSARGSFSSTLDRFPHEQAVFPSPDCLPIERYCGEDGAEVLLKGLARAAETLAGWAVGDLLGAQER